MKKEILRKISGLSIVIGLIIIFGSAGASDLEVISANEFMIRGIIGILLMLGGLLGLKKGGYRFE